MENVGFICLKQDLTLFAWVMISLFGCVIRRYQILYRQLSLVPCEVDVIILTGVENAMNRLVASKMRREFFSNASIYDVVR